MGKVVERSCLLRAWVDEIEAVPLMDGMMVMLLQIYMTFVLLEFK